MGSWLRKNRAKHRLGKLTLERRARLGALPGWTWNPHDEKWEVAYLQLDIFLRANGHARVPTNHKTSDGYPLGKWVNVQRVVFRNGTLLPERAERLGILSGWVWDPLIAQWEIGYNHLVAFIKHTGSARMPTKFEALDEFRLSQWIGRQRSAFLAGKLSSDNAKRLEALPGWVWIALSDQWEAGFAFLVSYTDHEGHSRPPQTFQNSDGFSLGTWVSSQRNSYNKGKLSSARIAQLEALTHWSWDPISAKWEAGFNHLIKFAAREGHTRVSRSFKVVDGYPLGSWVSTQRVFYGKRKLSIGSMSRLDELPGWVWDLIAAQWDEGYAHLAEYARCMGHVIIPQNHKPKDGFRPHGLGGAAA